MLLVLADPLSDSYLNPHSKPLHEIMTISRPCDNVEVKTSKANGVSVMA
jgi:hypothetical protein